jgi:hypothetical protein
LHSSLLSPTFFAFRKKFVQKSKLGARSKMYTQHAAIINDTMQFLFHGCCGAHCERMRHLKPSSDQPGISQRKNANAK